MLVTGSWWPAGPVASVLLWIAACSLWGATPLAVVRPTVSDRDGGAAVPGSFVHDPGETMFFSFQVDGFTASSGDRVHLTYKMEAFDPHGVRLMEPVAAEIEETSPRRTRTGNPRSGRKS
jgi:hypothetical protein